MPLRASGLNPFAFRASAEPGFRTGKATGSRVSIPLLSGPVLNFPTSRPRTPHKVSIPLLSGPVLNPIRREERRKYPRLNPFAFRASAERRISGNSHSDFVSIPLLSGPVLNVSLGCNCGGTSLNPFAFRASAELRCFSRAIGISVSIPLLSGPVLNPALAQRSTSATCLNPFAFRASAEPPEGR